LLESSIKKTAGNFLCHEKIIFVIGGTQILILFIMISAVFLVFGVDLLPSDRSRAMPYICAFAVAIFIINTRLIDYESQSFAHYREIFEKMPRAKKIWGGVAIAVVVIGSVIGLGVLGGMSGEAHRAARMGLIQ
jgi:hypothetical protein